MARTRSRRVPPAGTAPRADVSTDEVLLHPEKHLEPITDELISELVAAGWERGKLVEACDAGMLYCRPRNSFFTMPEFEGF